MQMSLILVSVCYIAIGVVLLLFPQVSMPSICGAVGILLLIVGAVSIAWYFLRKRYLENNHWGFSLGVAECILGLLAVLRTQQMAAAFALVLALCMVADNIIKVQFSMDLLRLKKKLWLGVLIVSLVMAALAVISMLVPFPTEAFKNTFTYVILVVDGVLNIVTMWYLSSQLKKRMQEAAELPQEKGTETVK